ncbi:hypothetical protein LTR10_018125 [Elasticomyces elasticus]|nr:hypothetical protein LTR10_018125 [Elasticomyces elasticus]KAK5025121.1 hypothetical protein LTR13_010558 [Exophiala sideris]KAK5176903.1 hypothetical protein LTR44_010599 [Eurotiomycetes sp. CCFEE 6388]
MRFRSFAELGQGEGTVQLIENLDAANVVHNLHLRGTDVVLVPQPSNDINDPLRWPKWKKHVAFLNVAFFAFMVTGYVGGFAPALYLLGIEFQKSQTETINLILWPLLLSGLGNFFWVPAAEYVGKRPVFVVASLITFLGMVGSAVSKDFHTLLACRILVSGGGSATEALGAAIINDIFFLHERGSKMGLYIIFLYGGNSLMPLISGFVIDGAGWRWFCWLCAILSGINFLAIFFFVEETRFDRTTTPLTVQNSHAVPEKSSPDPQMEQLEKPELCTTEEASPPAVSDSQLTGVKKTYIQGLSLWSGVSEISFFSHFMRPYLMIVYPAIIWAMITYSLALAWQISSNTVTSFIFQPPPYSWSPSLNGLINIPAMIGNLVGAYVGGHLTDQWARRWARQHDGIFIAESRLVLLIVPGLLVPTGLLMFGFGAERQLHWIVMFIGYGLLASCNAAASIGMTYVMDSYYEVAAEGLLLVNGLKNLIAWAFTYGFIPWTETSGYARVFGTMAALFFVWMLAAVPMYFYGKAWRDWTARKMKVIFW